MSAETLDPKPLVEAADPRLCAVGRAGLQRGLVFGLPKSREDQELGVEGAGMQICGRFGAPEDVDQELYAQLRLLGGQKVFLLVPRLGRVSVCLVWEVC